MSHILDLALFHILGQGRTGALGASLAALALLADAGLLRPMEGRLETLVTSNQRAMLVPSEERRLLADPKASEKLALEAEAGAALHRIFEAADASGIELVRGDYRLTQETGASYRTYQFTLPVTGEYPEIRQFLAKILADEPALALNGLLMRRDNIETTRVEATLRISLYLEART